MSYEDASYRDVPDGKPAIRHKAPGAATVLPFLGVSAVLSLLGLLTTTPVWSQWFTSSPRVEWTPQIGVFTLGWTVVYVLDGVAGWLLWRALKQAANRMALGLYWVQIALQAAWLLTFIAQTTVHGAWLWAVFAVIVVLDIVTGAAAAAAWQPSRPAGVLLLIVLLWLLFGTVLSGADTILLTGV